MSIRWNIEGGLGRPNYLNIDHLRILLGGQWQPEEPRNTGPVLNSKGEVQGDQFNCSQTFQSV